MNYPELWNKCTAFHGHACGGLALGFRAACYAMELLELNFSRDEELVCIAENDACGIEHIISDETFAAIKAALRRQAIYEMSGKKDED